MKKHELLGKGEWLLVSGGLKSGCGTGIWTDPNTTVQQLVDAAPDIGLGPVTAAIWEEWKKVGRSINRVVVKTIDIPLPHKGFWRLVNAAGVCTSGCAGVWRDAEATTTQLIAQFIDDSFDTFDESESDLPSSPITQAVWYEPVGRASEDSIAGFIRSKVNANSSSSFFRQAKVVEVEQQVYAQTVATMIEEQIEVLKDEILDYLEQACVDKQDIVDSQGADITVIESIQEAFSNSNAFDFDEWEIEIESVDWDVTGFDPAAFQKLMSLESFRDELKVTI